MFCVLVCHHHYRLCLQILAQLRNRQSIWVSYTDGRDPAMKAIIAAFQSVSTGSWNWKQSGLKPRHSSISMVCRHLLRSWLLCRLLIHSWGLPLAPLSCDCGYFHPGNTTCLKLSEFSERIPRRQSGDSVTEEGECSRWFQRLESALGSFTS